MMGSEDKTDMSVHLDVTLDKKSLYQFLLYHNYMRPSGVIGVCISIAALVVLVLEWGLWNPSQRVMLAVLALLFTVIQPVMLLSKGRRQLQMEEFQIPFHYVFDETGIVISQNDQRQEFTWDDVRKVKYRKSAVYVYMSTVSAFIIPDSQCQGHFEELVQLMKNKV